MEPRAAWTSTPPPPIRVSGMRNRWFWSRPRRRIRMHTWPRSANRFEERGHVCMRILLRGRDQNHRFRIPLTRIGGGGVEVHAALGSIDESRLAAAGHAAGVKDRLDIGELHAIRVVV